MKPTLMTELIKAMDGSSHQKESELNGKDGHGANLPPISPAEIINCSFNMWYPLFKPHSIRSWIITPSSKVFEYLNSDTIIVPTQFSKGGIQEMSQLSDDDLENEACLYNTGATTDLNDSGDETEKENYEFLEELNLEVKQAISALGGEVFPKLNWSAPKDARWIAPTKSLKCCDLSDILLLLKSSDDIAHDLTQAYGLKPEEKPPTVLVLKQWRNLDPSMEFRCFIIHHTLVGICQRDTNHYPYLHQEEDWLKLTISTFICKKVIPIFPSRHFVVDVYAIHSSRTVKVVDFNPVCSATHPLLFDWPELLQASTTLWKVIRDPSHGQLAQSQRTSFNQTPKDLEDFSSADFDEALQQLALLT